MVVIFAPCAVITAAITSIALVAAKRKANLWRRWNGDDQSLPGAPMQKTVVKTVIFESSKEPEIVQMAAGGT
jgi:hypothetical protein